MMDSLQSMAEAAPPALQWSVVVLGGAIPFIESYFGSVLGILAGVNPFIAIPAAIIGNIGSMALLVVFADRLRGMRTRTPGEPSARRRRFKRSFDRYGVAGVSLLGQTILPSQITALAMVGFGADKRTVIFWQIISIIIWGAAFGTLGALGVDAFTG